VGRKPNKVEEWSLAGGVELRMKLLIPGRRTTIHMTSFPPTNDQSTRRLGILFLILFNNENDSMLLSTRRGAGGGLIEWIRGRGSLGTWKCTGLHDQIGEGEPMITSICLGQHVGRPDLELERRSAVLPLNHEVNIGPVVSLTGSNSGNTGAEGNVCLVDEFFSVFCLLGIASGSSGSL